MDDFNKQSVSLDSFLNKLEKQSKSTSDKGRKFETLMKKALLEDDSIAGKFDKIWLWDKFPYKDDSDTGIDLVAYREQGKAYVAIQCKFYKEQTYLKDISTFISKANTQFKVENKKKSYSEMILISTTDDISNHAQKQFSTQAIKTSIISKSDLRKSKINWDDLNEDKFTFMEKKDVNKRPYQKEAIAECLKGLKSKDRGKLIMACGTGKTFTSLKLTESFSKEGDFILFLVPSIALMSQTIREWLKEKDMKMNVFAVCSDKTTGKAKQDSEDISASDMPYSATTDIKNLKHQIENTSTENKLNVIFSTYQSIDVIIASQKKNILPKFHLTICDEAHRTTGHTFKGADQSHFTKVHHKVLSAKRLYMTATPRIYKDCDKTKLTVNEREYFSMDEEKDYGKVFFKYGFSKAVEEDFLSDYKVIVLTIPEVNLNKKQQKDLTSSQSDIDVSDRARIIGCYQGLQKKFLTLEGEVTSKVNPMKRAVAFCRRIDESKNLSKSFQSTIEAEGFKEKLECKADHVDGTMSAGVRDNKIDWLKQEQKDNECRILFNARCLSEGVDVPSLDAVMFLNPKGSEIEIVQSVGRVMRKAPGKKYGYIIIPVVIPAGMTPSEALKDNKKYKVIWQVIQALRSHDEKLKHEIEGINQNKASKKIIITQLEQADIQDAFDFTDWKDKIYGQVVLKCGDRLYWDDWARDISTLANDYFKTIEGIIKKDEKRKAYFDNFLEGFRSILNESINQEDVIKMISQHLISKPIFDSLFKSSSALSNSPISQNLDKIIEQLKIEARTDVEAVHKVHKAIRDKAKTAESLEQKQKIVKELYSEFFSKAFKKDADRLGIAYTPVEIVDFMIESVEHLLNKEFNESLNDKGLKILDPFTGTGTFITRLIQSKIIKNNLAYKFQNDILSNEIVLLPYYISKVNAEESFVSVTRTNIPFQNGILTDTLSKKDFKKPNKVFPVNFEKIKARQNQKMKVIISNPPYSGGQKSANDGNKNNSYPEIEQRVKETYSRLSQAKKQKIAKDTYAKAFRWASDKLEDRGVIAFVHPSSLFTGVSADGMRKSLSKEFNKIYIFDLRGSALLKDEASRREGDKIFGQSCRNPIGITFLVKNEIKKNKPAEIFYKDIGDYLKREDKFNILKEFKSIEQVRFKKITEDKHGDWLDHRQDYLQNSIIMGDRKNEISIFNLYSCGVATSRDAWVYSFNKKEVSKNMKQMILFYNQEITRLKQKIEFKKFNDKSIDEHINRNPKKISWSRGLKQKLLKEKTGVFKDKNIQVSSYRPFMKSYFYFSKMFNECVYQNPKIWLNPKFENIKNKVICISGNGANTFSVLMSDAIPDYNFITPTQSFPLYYFDSTGSLQDGISDFALNKFKIYLKDISIKKEDIFYYIYGILHSKDFVSLYKDALVKDLPQIPIVKDFSQFSKIGSQLSKLHLNYEDQTPLNGIQIFKQGKKIDLEDLKKEDLTVSKMKFSKNDKKENRSIIHFNQSITIQNIPQEAYNYKINGCPAIKEILENYQVKTHKDSGIVNDPNSFSEDCFYIIKLLLSIITLSIKSNLLIDSLPSLAKELGETNKEIDSDLLIKRALVYAMISDKKIQKVERSAISNYYKVIYEALHEKFIFPQSEIESHLQKFINKHWSEETLLKDFKNCDISEDLKKQILEGIIKVSLSDKETHEKEIIFLENVAKVIQFSESKYQALLKKYNYNLVSKKPPTKKESAKKPTTKKESAKKPTKEEQAA